jgi:hypothetical protein
MFFDVSDMLLLDFRFGRQLQSWEERWTAPTLLNAKRALCNDMSALQIAAILIWLGLDRLLAFVSLLRAGNDLRALDRLSLSTAARLFKPCKMA